MSFIQKVIETTKNSQSDRAEYDRVSNVLYNIVNRRVKKEVLARAEDGYTTATIDLLNDISVDISSKWTISDLLFGYVFQDATPVVDRMFRGESSSFEGFDITGQAHVISLDWTMAMLGEKPSPRPLAPTPDTPRAPAQTPPTPDTPRAPAQTPPTPDTPRAPAQTPFTPDTPRAPAQTPPNTPRAPCPFAHTIFCEELSQETQEEMLSYLASLFPTIVKNTEKK
jgi:hypothetical protein